MLFCVLLCVPTFFQIESETAAAEAISADTVTKVDQLNSDLSDLQSKMNENEFRVQNAENVASEAADLANKASKVCFFDKLYQAYDPMSLQISRLKF